MLLSFAYFKCCSGNVYLKSYHEQNGEIEKFLSYAISKYSSEKNGFIIININHQFQDYTEFLTKNVFQHDAAVTVYDMRKLLFEWPRVNL